MKIWLKMNWLFSIAIMLGIFLIIYSLNRINIITSHDTQYYSGSYNKYETVQKPSTQGTITVRYLYIGDLIFYVNSISLQAFDTTFLSEVKPGDVLQVAYWKENKKPQIMTDNYLLSINKESTQYMDKDETISFIVKNYYLGLILGALFVLCGVLAICFKIK